MAIQTIATTKKNQKHRLELELTQEGDILVVLYFSKTRIKIHEVNFLVRNNEFTEIQSQLDNSHWHLKNQLGQFILLVSIWMVKMMTLII
jgi:hypothetical protein